MVLEQDQHLPESCIQKFGVDLVNGLHHIHSLGIVFSDLKPSNVMSISIPCSLYISSPQKCRLHLMHRTVGVIGYNRPLTLTLTLILTLVCSSISPPDIV